MASTKRLHGLPNDLVQQFFSTMFYYDKGYMSDWIWHTASKNNVETIDIDIINEIITPSSLQIKPIVSQLYSLRATINSVLTSNEFAIDFIVRANLKVTIVKDSKTNRLVNANCITVDKNGKIYESQIYSEEALEKDFNSSILDSIKNIFTGK